MDTSLYILRFFSFLWDSYFSCSVLFLIFFFIFFNLFVQVTWIRHRDLHLLTVDKTTYTSDQRFVSVNNPQIGDWSLQVRINKLNYSRATNNTKNKFKTCAKLKNGVKWLRDRERKKKLKKKTKKKRREELDETIFSLCHVRPFASTTTFSLKLFSPVWRAENLYF